MHITQDDEYLPVTQACSAKLLFRDNIVICFHNKVFEERFERDSRVYNIQAVSFTPAELVEEMRKHLSNFVVEYHPDERQAIGGCGFDN